MQTFLVRHLLRRPNGGLVIARHNEICDDIIYLVKQAFSPNYACIKPLIHLSRIRYEEEVRHIWIVPETQGGMSIRGLWES